MTKCKNCKYFAPHGENEWLGFCQIELPSWVTNALDDRLVSRLGNKDDGCDLVKEQS